jgi:serine/threonine-protein kinase
MSVEANGSLDGDAGATSEEAALARVLESYLSGLEAGRPADPVRLIADHPDLAGPLRACLKVMHLAAGLSEATCPAAARAGGEAAPDAPEGIGGGRYRVLGEIARGGMGVVLRARDVDLGRDLALKVLQARHRDDPGVIGRFVEEARIGGRLQHPGIVPVHELDTLADRRPFFTMKLVEGRTLAALLAERPTAATDLPRLLAIFEQVCQTVAYAHARRVIHRDLKPAKVMVGSFGEVQVVDWGLAKVLPEGVDVSDGDTAIPTDRGGPAGSDGESQPGSVLGTPSYMAPEQARGDIERLDERADVFGLGAILCEVITGRPPFEGSRRDEIRAKAALGDLADAMRHLDDCGADAELIDLARDCLAAEPERRPRDAGEVARRISAYQAGVRERLRAAELARVEAQARAEAAQARTALERSRRRRTAALAASVLALIVLAGGGWAYLERQRMERVARVALALREVEVLRDEARRAGDDLARWVRARDAARAVEHLLGDLRDEPTRARIAALVREVTEATGAAEADQELLARLSDIRGGREDDTDGSDLDAEYEAAFHEAGIDFDSRAPSEIGGRLANRPAAVRVALAAALDDWMSVRARLRESQAAASRIAEVARMVDPDPWRDQLREIRQISPIEDRLGRLKDLALPARREARPAVSLYLLGAALLDAGDPARAEGVLREAVRRDPGDVWLNHTLARCLARLGRRQEAIRYYMAARSIRPETAHPLAHLLEAVGETDRAIAIFEDLVRLRPQAGRHLTCLGVLLKGHGRYREARDILDKAASALHAEIGRQPGRPSPHNNLGMVLWSQGRHDEAIAEFRAAVRLGPHDPKPHTNLGLVLSQHGRLEEAVAEIRAALRLQPDFAEAHGNLGDALRRQGRREEAIAEYRAALRLRPDSFEAHEGLGKALHELGKLDPAIAEYREAIRLRPDHHEAHHNLGRALYHQGEMIEAIAELREAIRFDPDEALAHIDLGNALGSRGRLAEAIAEFREAIRHDPLGADAHYNLGNALRDQGRPDEAIAAFREAIGRRPRFPEAHNNLGLVLRSRGDYSEAVAEFRKACDLARQTSPHLVRKLEGNLAATERQAALAPRLPAVIAGQARPADAAELLDLAQVAHAKSLYGASARLWAEAFRADPDGAVPTQHRLDAARAAALAGCGHGRDDPPLDEAAKARWRKQAIDWLTANLAAWAKSLRTSPPESRFFIAQTLGQWRMDPDLTGLRDPGSVDKLTKDEQAACHALWKGVDALLARAIRPAP